MDNRSAAKRARWLAEAGRDLERVAGELGEWRAEVLRRLEER